MSKQTSATVVIRGAKLYGEDVTSIAIDADKIVALGADADALIGQTTRVIEADGLIALPGFVDLHTHLREPGQEDAETVYTGTRAAAMGGYTCVHAMANTRPVADTAAIVEQVAALGEKAGWCEVRPVGAVTVGLAGKQLSAMGAMAASAAQVRVFSDDGVCVSDPVLMRRALEYVKSFNGVIAQHAQDPQLTDGSQMNESALSAELGLAGWPAVAEEAIIARDVLLAEHVGSRVHICHLSTAGAVDIVRWAKHRGIQVTAEATPHHIYLSQEKARTYDPRYKVNPPLRTEADIEAVRAGLEDGTIDVIGTDHAPHPLESKDCEWQAGAFGMTGLETALAVLVKTMVETGRMSWRDVARVMSHTPAAIGQVADQGEPIEVGASANLTLIDPRVCRVVTAEQMWSRSANSPYLGEELPTQVMWTIWKGQITVAEGKPVAKEERC